MGKFVKIIIASAAKDLDKPFTYAAGKFEGRLTVGQRVLVPFGKYRQVEGFVVDFAHEIDFDASKLKEVTDILEEYPIFSTKLLELAHWMAEKYFTPLAICLKTIMPTGIALKNDFVAEIAEGNGWVAARGKSKQILDYLTKHGAVSQRELVENFGKTVQTSLNALADRDFIKIRHIYDVKDYTIRVNMAFPKDDTPDFDEKASVVLEKGDKQAVVLEMLLEARSLSVADIQLRLGISPSPIKSLEQKGLIGIEKVERRRNVLPDVLPESEIFKLTAEQGESVSNLLVSLNSPAPRPVLIHGVTGSGKTEIYMRAISHAISQGRQAIMLVPEIALTPQAVAAFTARFGRAVAVTHSRLSLGERFDQWKQARDGLAQVIVGPRSAIFTPFANLGIIIIDEEHENTYKSENAPKYDTIAVARKLAELSGALLVLGSATPGISTYFQSQLGIFDLFTIKHRVNRQFPKIEIADMRRELAQGNKTIFSAALHSAIAKNLVDKQQTILFLNRRGHSTFVSCRSCGQVLTCTTCSVNYTYHVYNQRLMCHYCGSALKMPKNCPTCGSVHIKYFGVGTQKIEEYLAETFPGARVLRMDLDTTGTKNSHTRIINAFADGQADILVGTQMIAKGLNFPGVSLVGIVAADMALNNGDYRGAETAYQLITQVSGRAGRGEIPGRVILQTYNPEHYSIKYAVDNNYQAFYSHEVEIRRQMNYPPFSHIFMLLFIGKEESPIIQTLHKLADIMQASNRKGLCEILGPAPAVIRKIRQNYRWKLLVKCCDEEILKKFVFYCLDKLKKNADTEGITMNLTLDPAYIV